MIALLPHLLPILSLLLPTFSLGLYIYSFEYQVFPFFPRLLSFCFYIFLFVSQVDYYSPVADSIFFPQVPVLYCFSILFVYLSSCVQSVSPIFVFSLLTLKKKNAIDSF